MKQRKKIAEPFQEAINDVELGNFELRLRIDKYSLDTEVSEQPRTAEEVSDRYAMAKSLRDLAKDDLKTIEAQRGIDIREEKESAKEKVTEKTIADLVQVDTKRQAAYRRYVEAERTMTKLEGLRDSYRERGFMLKEMCGLYHAAYFSDPSHRTADDPAAKDEAYSRNRANMAARRKERGG